RPKPILFQSRWALSFLRGPLTREQVGELMQPLKEQPPLAIPLCTFCHADLGPDTVDKCPKCGRDPYANASFRVLDREFRHGLLAEPEAPGHPVEWDGAGRTDGRLDPGPIAKIRWANVPESLDTGKKLKALERGFVEYLYATRKLSLFENRPLELVSAPGESEA